MFERVFKRAFAITRHASAPYADERARYLSYCLERGEKPITVRMKAFELLRVARQCKRAYSDLHLAPNPTDSIGLQFLKRDHGGFLGKEYRSKSGLPVVNISGCPAHPDWITQVLVAIATGRAADVTLDDLQRPRTLYSTFTQTGCTRNMHFAYKVSATEFGQRKGCLFYDLGCRGPMTHSPCNQILWNRQSSKTRAGMPCLGCTEPEFPFSDLAPGTVFKTGSSWKRVGSS
ncbi:MAG TPA: hypothetical protein VGG63_11305 [Steroidobacteraceae bacterium]|jgi:hypothetical protein